MNLMKQVSDKCLSFKLQILADNLDMYTVYFTYIPDVCLIYLDTSLKKTQINTSLYTILMVFLKKKGSVIGNRCIEN